MRRLASAILRRSLASSPPCAGQAVVEREHVLQQGGRLFGQHGLDRDGDLLVRSSTTRARKPGRCGRGRTAGRCCPGPQWPGPTFLRPSCAAAFPRRWPAAASCSLAPCARSRRSPRRPPGPAASACWPPGRRRPGCAAPSATDARPATPPGLDRPVFQEALQVASQLAGRLIAVVRLAGDGLQHDRLQVARDSRIELARPRRLAVGDLARSGCCGCCRQTPAAE